MRSHVLRHNHKVGRRGRDPGVLKTKLAKISKPAKEEQMFKFVVVKTNSKTHPWRVELDGGPVAECSSKNIAELIAETLENDNRHAIVQDDLAHDVA